MGFRPSGFILGSLMLLGVIVGLWPTYEKSIDAERCYDAHNLLTVIEQCIADGPDCIEKMDYNDWRDYYRARDVLRSRLCTTH